MSLQYVQVVIDVWAQFLLSTTVRLVPGSSYTSRSSKGHIQIQGEINIATTRVNGPTYFSVLYSPPDFKPLAASLGSITVCCGACGDT
mmetsp:Transcript_11783/g.21500  ORF Transcript_11783/g.21500 Transcript_11783/m.21500 type:complete len:88 (+) Transcript_11783:1451-1714(+)